MAYSTPTLDELKCIVAAAETQVKMLQGEEGNEPGEGVKELARIVANAEIWLNIMEKAFEDPAKAAVLSMATTVEYAPLTQHMVSLSTDHLTQAGYDHMYDSAMMGVPVFLDENIPHIAVVAVFDLVVENVPGIPGSLRRAFTEAQKRGYDYIRFSDGTGGPYVDWLPMEFKQDGEDP